MESIRVDYSRAMASRTMLVYTGKPWENGGLMGFHRKMVVFHGIEWDLMWIPSGYVKKSYGKSPLKYIEIVDFFH